METIERNGIKISLHLLKDRSVDLSKMMRVVAPLSQDRTMDTECYPSNNVGKNYGTIEEQFEYAKVLIRFNEVSLKAGGTGIGVTK